MGTSQLPLCADMLQLCDHFLDHRKTNACSATLCLHFHHSVRDGLYSRNPKNRRRVIAVCAKTTLTHTTDGQKVPLSATPAGGSEDLRG